MPLYGSPPGPIARFFRKYVNEPFEKHLPTKEWVREIVKNEWGYHSSLIDRGRANFINDIEGLSPRDQIIVYCYYYMQTHTVSGYHTLRKCLEDHKMSMVNNPVFIDFGCGPLTGGISFAWYNHVHNKNMTNGVRCRYIGMDRSPEMLKCAEEMSQCGLFHSDSTFNFVLRNSLAEIPPLLASMRGKQGNRLKIILNCSYFFGSKSLNVDAFVRFMNDLLSSHTTDEDHVCLLFQNPYNLHENHKWSAFKSGVEDHLKSHVSESEDVSYYCITGRRNQPRNPFTIKLLREVLLNQTWKDHLESQA